MESLLWRLVTEILHLVSSTLTMQILTSTQMANELLVINYLGSKFGIVQLVMTSKGKNGIESGSAGADPLAIGVGYGEGNGGSGNSVHPLGPAELPVVELGLLGTSGGENDGVPGGNPRWVAHG